MIRSYFQNISVGMTKDQYFEMCESLGAEPDENEIPVEFNEFPLEVQEAIAVYYKLKDEWDTMNGGYMGKSFAGFADILDILEVPFSDRRLLLEWIGLMDSVRAKVVSESKSSSEIRSAESTEKAL